MRNEGEDNSKKWGKDNEEIIYENFPKLMKGINPQINRHNF